MSRKLTLKEREVLALERIAELLQRVVDDCEDVPDEAEIRAARRAPAPPSAVFTVGGIAEVLREWGAAFGTKPRTTAQALAFAERERARGWPSRLWTLFSGMVDPSPLAISREFTRWEGRDLDGLVLRRVGKERGGVAWAVEVAPSAIAAGLEAERARDLKRRPRDPSVAPTPPCSPACADGDCPDHGDTRAQFGRRP